VSIYNKIQQQDTRAGLSRMLGWPEVLISFSVTLSHSVPRHYTSCRGVSPTSQRVCITSRSCTKSQLGNWPTCIRPDLNPGLLLGRRSCYHYTTRPVSIWLKQFLNSRARIQIQCDTRVKHDKVYYEEAL